MTIVAGIIALLLAVAVGLVAWARRGPVAAAGSAIAALLFCFVAYALVVVFHLA